MTQTKEPSPSARGEEFLQLYNRLDHYLSKLTGSDQRTSFADRLNLAGPRHSVVGEHLYELAEFGRLRNFVWHSKGHALTSWAEPTREAVERFRELVDAIVTPEPLLPRFERPIRSFPPKAPLVEALAHMKENDYSQVVVEGPEGYGLLSVEGVARWVEYSYEADVISVRDATVGEAARFEPESSFVRLARKHTIEDARQVFLHRLRPEQGRVFAVLVTATGKPNEKPLGIVTPWDL